MKIDHIISGDFQTNCYVLRKDIISVECIVIDPGLDAEPLLNLLRENRLDPVATILTHGHADHIIAVTPLKQIYKDVKVCIHSEDADMLTDPVKNASAALGFPLKTVPADVLLHDGEMLNFAGISLKVIHTPGHTSGGICLYSESDEVLFSGDTLFSESIGRTDIGGNMDQILSSIGDRLFQLPPRTEVYPGHGPATTIGHEKTYNPFCS